MMELLWVFHSEMQIAEVQLLAIGQNGVLCSGWVSLINHPCSRIILHANIYPYVALWEAQERKADELT